MREEPFDVLFKLLNQFELLYQSINVINATRDYVEIYSITYPKNFTNKDKKDFLVRFYKQKFGIDYNDYLNKLENDKSE